MISIADFTKFDIDFQGIIVAVVCNFFFVITALELLDNSFIEANSLFAVSSLAVSISMAWVFCNMIIALPYLAIYTPYEKLSWKESTFVLTGSTLSVLYIIPILFCSYFLNLSAEQFVVVLASIGLFRFSLFCWLCWRKHGMRYVAEFREKSKQQAAPEIIEEVNPPA